jgi:Domain of unknown function (DUF5665)
MEKSVKEHQEIKKMSSHKKNTIESLSPEKADRIEGLIDAIGSAGLEEFMEYIRSPWKMLWPNFVAWVARGFGALVGATIVIGLIGWILTTLIDLPLIGKKLEPYVEHVQTEFKKYTEATNYKPYFEKMEESLRTIERNTTPKN